MSLQTASMTFLTDHFYGGRNMNAGSRSGSDHLLLQEYLEAVKADLATIDLAAVAGETWRETILEGHQLVDGASGGIAPAMIFVVAGIPSPTDTFTIDDGAGGGEVYTFVAGAPGAFEIQIGISTAVTMQNMVTSIMANSVLWSAYNTTGLNRFFAGAPAAQVVLMRKLADAADEDRVYATLTGAGAINIVEFESNGGDDYRVSEGTEQAIDATDPEVNQFGFGRAFADMEAGEAHMILESAVEYGKIWEEGTRAWKRAMFLGYTQAEINSTTGGSEGALLVGTDSKANLGTSTTVEACLTNLNTKNPPARSSQAGTPNAGAGTTGAIGDINVDTTALKLYFNPNAGATSWVVLASEDWVTATVRAGIAWREALLVAGQLINGAAGGVARAMLLSMTGLPSPTDTITIDDGVAPETYTAVAGAPGAWEFQIGGTVAATMVNLAASIMANSLLWNAYDTTYCDRYFAGVPANQIALTRKLAAGTGANDRVYATLTGAGAIQIVDFVTNGQDDYDLAAGNELAIPAADPGTGQFGFGRAIADLVAAETHSFVEAAAVLGSTWEEDAQAWRRSVIFGYTQAELNSIVGGAEGASLIGTDAKANLGAATTVEGCLTDLNTKNPPTRSTGAGSPNGVVAGDEGDLYVDVTNDVTYENVDGTNTGWRAQEDEDLGSVATCVLVQAGQPVAGQLLTINGDVYEADGVGANINFAIAGLAEGTMDNLLTAAVTNGAENLFWDKIDATHLRIRSADGPQGNIIAADPNLPVTYNLANYTLSTGTPGNFNALAGRAAGLSKTSTMRIVVTAAHIAAGQLRYAFTFTVVRFKVMIQTTTGALRMAATDTFTIDNGDVLVGLVGGGGDIAATDIVTIQAWA